MLTTEQIKEKLKEIKDPELGIDIVSLGLVRDITFVESDGIKSAEVLMTLTTPLCPFANDIVLAVEDKLYEIGIDEAKVELSFDPPWEASEELKTSLGL